MQKMIWIPDDLVEEIKEAAVREKKSVSNYLVDLHRNRQKFDSVVINHISYDKTVIDKDQFDTEVIEQLTEEIKKPITIKPKSRYTEDYRKKNPMEICSVPNCGKALKFNCGH